MKLFIIHNHFRPGGVRRVVELAAPHLIREARPRIEGVVLVAGEEPDAKWLSRFVDCVNQVPVSCRIDQALGYVAEQDRKPGDIDRHLRRFLSALFAGADRANCVVWAHNQGLGRNLLLTRQLIRLCARHRLPLILHHHDWWFDNRWQRWPELRRSGFRNLDRVAKIVFPAGADLRTVAVNQADTAILRRHFREQAAWLPNLAGERAAPAAESAGKARRWLHEVIGRAAPIWLMPCRLVRRKNIAEALLLTRWLRPEAWLVTTGGASSADEEWYAERLAQAARQHHWPLRLGVLRGDESKKPAIPELIAASEAILLTSLQEGFGLPYIEAAAARRPLLARCLPNMEPDLRKFGFRFPQSYKEILVAPTLFDWTAEHRRQRELFRLWLRQLPRSCRKCVPEHPFLTGRLAPHPVPFSRLTLSAQLEVLAWPAADSFARCVSLNPRLKIWRGRAAAGKLAITPWPASAAKWLSGLAYARRFSRLLAPVAILPTKMNAPLRAQEDFLRAKLASQNLYPILWSTQS